MNQQKDYGRIRLGDFRSLPGFWSESDTIDGLVRMSLREAESYRTSSRTERVRQYEPRKHPLDPSLGRGYERKGARESDRLFEQVRMDPADLVGGTDLCAAQVMTIVWEE